MDLHCVADELIAAIHADIALADRELDRPEVDSLQRHPFFHSGLQDGRGELVACGTDKISCQS